MKKAGGFTKRMVALLLSGMLAVGTIPGTALAAEVQENTVQEEEAITTYTVTLDANGGYFVNEWDDVIGEYIESTEILNKQIPVGGTVTTFPVKEQENMIVTFMGWSLERDGGVISLGQELYSPVGDCTLYAVWGCEELEDSSSDENNTEELEDDTSSDAYPDSETEEEKESSEVLDPDQQDELTGKESISSDEIEEKNGETFGDSGEQEGPDLAENESSGKEGDSIRKVANNGVVESESSKSVAFAGGNGTQSEPYQVSDAEQLNAIRNNLEAHYVQTADIDLNGVNWVPIAGKYPSSNQDPFTGVFDGNGFSIKNLKIQSNKSDELYGLFGNNNGTIRNVVIHDCEIIIDCSIIENSSSLSPAVGSIAGHTEKSIYNCESAGTIEVINAGRIFVGGIVGYGNASYSRNYININANTINFGDDANHSATLMCGGITGEPSSANGTIENCVNYGNIYAESDYRLFLGGISGEYGGIKNCVNYGNISGQSLNPNKGWSTFAAICNVGGIVGATYADTLDDCLNFGNIAGRGKSSCYVGGIAGWNGYYSAGSIRRCYNIGGTIVSDGVGARVAGCVLYASELYSIDSTTINGAIPVDNIGQNSINGESLTKAQMVSAIAYILDELEIEWEPEVGNLFAPVDSAYLIDKYCYFRSGLANDDTIKYTFNYNDDWVFSNDQYDCYRLMQTSMRVAMTAFGAKEDNWSGPANIKGMMSTMKFSYTDDSIYYPVPTKENVNTLGSAIGLKNIKLNEGSFRSIILVAIRGGGYGTEWGGNFRVGSGGNIDSVGFRDAADQVETRLRSFIETNRDYISDDLRIWITGFSRGGATSNLVAADLINGKCAIQGVSSTEVIAFCFECPKTTTDSNADSVKYNNIISIVNPNDFVPKVPMKLWGFKRYGQTLYIPSVETTSQFTKRFKIPMIRKYSALFEENGIPENEDVVVEKIGQASLLDSFFDHLAFCIPRKDYEAVYQDSIVDIASSCLGNAGSPDWIEAVPSMLGVLETALLRPGLTIGVLKLFTKGKPSPGPNSHYPELCMSWIDSLLTFDSYISEENSWYRRVLINCPVNVTVKNSSGEIVGCIVNDEVEEIEDGIVVRIDEDGQKTFVLPLDEEYTVEIQGTDEGTVNYTVEDYNFDTNTTEKVINYKEIEISEGTEIVGTVSEAENIGETETTLHLKEDQETIEPDEVLIGDEVVSYSVEVSSAGNGNVFGGGRYVKGEFTKITAEADEGFEFSGWYEDDECVSTEYEYRFAVADNTSLTAVFIPEILISFENESITLNTGKTAVLNVSISSPDVELDKCKWSSSDQNVANVDEKGTVTAQTPGMTVITVTTEDGKHSASCNVSVKGLIENADISGISDMTYTGEKLSHNLIIRDGDNSLAKDIDYYVEYSDNTNAGTATLTISGIDKYEGTVTKTFTINPASIANATLSGISSKIYTGKVQTQSPVVKIGDKTLVNETDYFLTYTNNTNAGTATITITGTGNYSGTKEETFTINKAAQSITVKSTATSIAVGKTATVLITGAKGTKSFKSSNPAIATVNASTGVVTGKKAGTVTITATSAATSNYNAASKTVKITVTANKSLKKPGNCHFAKWNNAKYTSCQIAWNKVAGADGYQTLLSWTNGTHASTTIVQSYVLYRNCTVHPQHVSQMKVRAFYTEGGKRVFGPWSNVEYITPSPAKLTAKNASSGSNLKMNISWNIIYGCNGYNVFITTNPNGTWYWNQSTTTNATATSAVITKYRGSGLKKNTRYYVRIVTRRKRNGVFCTVPMPAKNTYVGSFIIK